MRTTSLCLLPAAALMLVVGLGAPLTVRAQDSGDSATPPPRPYVAPLKGDFTMLERISYDPKTESTGTANSGQAPAAGSQLQEVQAVETGIVRKDKKLFGDGTSTEIWRSGALRFLLDSKSPDGVVVASHEMSYYNDPPDFQEVEWIGPKSYQGVQLLGDKNCYYYVQGEQKAWIDETTKWPLRYDSPTMHISYSYGAPSGPLQLPPICAKKFEQMRRAWAGLPK